ncbi:copper resistance protein CopC [Streptomyces sp. YIM 130001]|uniref:copper resistance CopC/CopD family protein n=1 Tax=Streptomyces sp. YIM 130001 TaxID=2259644 RepID=UPI001F08D0F5|nr:copper resistance protein CopC [Streptomyces sp. YIM 130001]
MPRTGQLLLLLVVTLGSLLVWAAPADAHAALTGSDPKQGSVVEQAPEQVELSFSEKVALSKGSIRVLDPAGKRADKGTISDLSSGSDVRYATALKPGLPDGTYTVAWQAVSADSHPVSGAFTFSIGAASDTSVALPDTEAGGGVVGTLYGAARYVAYAGFAVLVGGAAFLLICWPRGAGLRPLQRLVVGGWLALTASTLAMLLLRGSYTGSGKLGDVFDLGSLGDVLSTKTGAALVSRLLLLAAAALFVAVLFGAYARRDEGDGGAPDGEPGAEKAGSGRAPRDADERRDLGFGLGIGGAVVAIGLAATWALAEHASTGIQTALAMPMDVVHLLAVALWLGGLAALLVALYRAPAVPRPAVLRFSSVAFWSVVALAVTGVYQSWRQVGSWSALTGTWYGQLLLIKIGLIAVLVGMARISRRWTARLSVTTDEGTNTEPAEDTEAPDAAGGGGERTGKGTGKSDRSGPGTRAREAQLARQRAAVEAAADKRRRDGDPERLGLRRTVLAEAAVAVAVLAVTTVLTGVEPGRTEEEASNRQQSASSSEQSGPTNLELPFDTGGENGRGTVRLELTPGRTGNNDLHLFADTPGGKPFDVPEIKVSLTLKAKDIGPLPVTPEHITTGHWSASGVQVPMGGDWQFSVTVRTSDIDQVTVTRNAKIG